MSSKFYAVKIAGDRIDRPVILDNWAECQQLIKGVYSKFKSFPTYDQARAWLNEDNGFDIFDNVNDLSESEVSVDYGNAMCANGKEAPVPEGYIATEIEKNDYHVYTDGSYNPATKMAGYGIVYIDPMTGNVEKRSGQVKDSYTGRNVTGELTAVIIALTDAKAWGAKSVKLMYDYEGIGAWVNGEWAAKSAISKNFLTKFKELTEGISVKLVKVPAHSGEDGNEWADRLAKAGCGMN